LRFLEKEVAEAIEELDQLDKGARRVNDAQTGVIKDLLDDVAKAKDEGLAEVAKAQDETKYWETKAIRRGEKLKELANEKYKEKARFKFETG